MEQPTKDSVEISSKIPENEEIRVAKRDADYVVVNEDKSKNNNLHNQKDDSAFIGIKANDTKKNSSSNDSKIKSKQNTSDNISSLFNKILPKKNEQISAKTILGMSTLASGVALVVGLFNKSFYKTAGIIAAFFTPYLLTKGVEIISEQNVNKKDQNN